MFHFLKQISFQALCDASKVQGNRTFFLLENSGGGVGKKKDSAHQTCISLIKSELSEDFEWVHQSYEKIQHLRESLEKRSNHRKTQTNSAHIHRLPGLSEFFA